MLGARRSDVLALVLRQGVRLVGIGVAIGLATSFGLARTLAALLYQAAEKVSSIRRVIFRDSSNT